jgi:predicted RNA binding protein YcfA (HicA-like mRNA interferase family)
VNKDLRTLIKELEAQGFEVTKGRNSTHLVVRKKGQRVTTLPSTPSDHRTMKNCLADCRRAGFKWPH